MPAQHEIAEGLRFDSFAPCYDENRGQHPIRTQVREEAVALIGRLKPRNVVDVGCGTGKALVALSETITTGTGLDVSRKMLDVARRNAASAGCGNLEFHFGSFLDLETRTFWPTDLAPDVIMQTYALHHLPREEKRRSLACLANAVRAARGSIVLGDLIFFEPPVGLESEFSLVGYDPTTDLPETADTLAQMLENLGFSVQRFPVHPLAGVIAAAFTGKLA
jgi:SAM-dependent methyltransferase